MASPSGHGDLKLRAPPPRAIGGSLEKIMWQPIASAPFGVDLELAVIDRDGVHALVFPCRRGLTGWVKSEFGERVDVSPTHWRGWAARERQAHN